MLFLSAMACSDAAPSSTSGGPSSSTESAAPAAQSTSAATSAKPASSQPASSWGAFPKAARRDSPPPGIETRVLDKGATAPAIAIATAKDMWTLSDALSKSQHVVLIFFRGAW